MNQYGNRGIGSYGARMGLGPAVFLLLLANVAVFLFQFLVAGFSGRDPIGAWGSFIPYFAMQKLQLWRFFTYMFLHGSFTHIAFNMLGLWLFGSRMEALWGSRTFTWFYFAAGVGGALVYGVFSLAGVSALVPMVGASGAIYGILLAFGLAFPNAIIFVFFFPMPARIAVVVFAAISLLGIGGANVAHLAHLGGMLTGLAFLWFFTGGHPSQVPRLPGGRSRRTRAWSDGLPRSRAQQRSLWQQTIDAYHRWRTGQRLHVVDKTSDKDPAPRPGNGKTRGGVPVDRVDEILEKISREGLKSLTAEEQDILRRASRRD
ncbi:MAG: rhomboid family intramembrane serine protease [Candidatus Krumholzibacteriia bacterium]